jgi:hypothetical protein
MLHEAAQQTELESGQHLGARAADGRGLMVFVQFDAAAGQPHPADDSAPKERLDTCEQFLDVERFSHIIVGASLQPLDAFVPLVARGQHDDWNHHTGSAPPSQDVKPRHPRETEVEHDDVVLLSRAEKLASLAVPRTIDRVPGALEVSLERRPYDLIVFDQQQTHCDSLSIGSNRHVWSSTYLRS